METALKLAISSPSLTPVEDALATIRAHAQALSAEHLPVHLAEGRWLACDVASAVDVPPFDNSAMDGFALHAGARALPAGTCFDVVAEQAAGDAAQRVSPNAACEIMTGARMPDGLDTVIPVEQVEVIARRADGRPARIRLLAALTHDRHVRKAGSDVAINQPMLRAGTRIGAAERMLLAATGHSHIEVRRRPRIALLCTGRELVDDAARVLQPGEIHNSNAAWLRSRIVQAGGELVYYQTIPDLEHHFERALAESLHASADIVISTGAVSMGRHDFVPTVLARLGARTLFHKVAMRPGKPLLFAQLAQGPLYFGLPGNPVSSVIGFRFFVEPALRQMLGLAPEHALQLPLIGTQRKAAGYRVFLKATLQMLPHGRLAVAILGAQESYRVAPLVQTFAWAALPAEREQCEQGSLIDVYPIGHEHSLVAGVTPHEH